MVLYGVSKLLEICTDFTLSKPIIANNTAVCDQYVWCLRTYYLLHERTHTLQNIPRPFLLTWFNFNPSMDK